MSTSRLLDFRSRWEAAPNLVWKSVDIHRLVVEIKPPHIRDRDHRDQLGVGRR